MLTQFSHSNDIKKLVINYLGSHQYDQLESLIKQFSSMDTERFFQKSGYGILSYVIIDSHDISALAFIVNMIKMEIFPKQTAQEILNYEGFDILRNFLIGRYTQESYIGEYAQDKRDLMIEKFKLLFEIDPSGMRDFITTNQSEYYASDTIKEDFRKIIESKKITQAF
jgi:hypothetical protein